MKAPTEEICGISTQGTYMLLKVHSVGYNCHHLQFICLDVVASHICNTTKFFENLN